MLTTPTSSLSNGNASIFVNSPLTLASHNVAATATANAMAKSACLVSPLREFVSKPENSAVIL